MAYCSECGTQLAAAAAFCGACGTRAGGVQIEAPRPMPQGRFPGENRAFNYSPAPIHEPATVPPHKGGFIQTFGLDIRAAILAVIVDMLASGLTGLSLGLFYIVEFMSGIALTFITYRIQKNWYGDNHDSALIKGCVIGLLTAIPAPITGLFAVPCGALGIIHLFRKKD